MPALFLLLLPQVALARGVLAGADSTSGGGEPEPEAPGMSPGNPVFVRRYRTTHWPEHSV